MKISLCFAWLLLSVPTVVSAQQKSKTKESSPILKNGLDTFSYAVGMNIADNMKQQGITELNLAVMSKAFDDVFRSQPTLLTQDQASMNIQQKMQEYNERRNAALRAKGEEFLAQNKKRPGMVTTVSGIQYEVLKAGDPNGPRPTAADTVVVDYVGTLIDGKEFDNSIKRGQPATFPLGGVIKGWTEVLQLMTPGSQWKVYIPSDLGYGERGAGGSIPPFATLIFEITLRDIKKAAVK